MKQRRQRTRRFRTMRGGKSIEYDFKNPPPNPFGSSKKEKLQVPYFSDDEGAGMTDPVSEDYIPTQKNI